MPFERIVVPADGKKITIENKVKPLSQPTSIPERPVFREIDLDRVWEVPGYRRNLPHWRVEGATYFVTFRLSDSIPRSVVQRWEDDRTRWLRSHKIDPAWQQSDAGRFYSALASIPQEDPGRFEIEQSRQFFVELDKCHGCCVLTKTHQMVADSLDHFHGKRIWTGDYVIMPNHVHVLVQPFPGIDLESWLYSLKRFSATKIKKAVLDVPTRASHLWQTESFDRIVRDVLPREGKYHHAYSWSVIENEPHTISFWARELNWTYPPLSSEYWDLLRSYI